MKKNIIEVYFDKLNENSIIVFKDKKWTAVDKNIFLNGVQKKLNVLDGKIDTEKNERNEDVNLLKEEIKSIKKTLSYILGEDENEEE